MHSWILFVHRKVPLSKIKEIILFDNGYTFYLKGGKRFATINAIDPLAGEMVRYVEKFGAKYRERDLQK